MTSRPPKRPAPRPALQRPTMLGGAGPVASHAQAPAASGAVPDMAELMQQFDAALHDLQNDPSLDRDMREQLRQQFAQALSDVATGENAPAGIPDRAVWMDAVQALQANGTVKESEANDLIRQINQALEPLQRRESQLAIEFSRRLQTEGEEKALAWFRKQSKAHANDAAADPSPRPSGDVSPMLRTEVVNSRSRRLRGPP